MRGPERMPTAAITRSQNSLLESGETHVKVIILGEIRR